VKGTTGTVYYDFVLICKGQFTFPFISGQVSLDATPRNIDIPIPGKVGDNSQNLGSPGNPIHLSGEIDSASTWKDSSGIVAGVLYDIAHNSYREPWQWFTSDECNMKVKLASGPLISQLFNVSAVRTFDMILKEYRGQCGSNETYLERYGLV
jgi:hypothetical protein